MPFSKNTVLWASVVSLIKDITSHAVESRAQTSKILFLGRMVFLNSNKIFKHFLSLSLFRVSKQFAHSE